MRPQQLNQLLPIDGNKNRDEMTIARSARPGASSSAPKLIASSGRRGCDPAGTKERRNMWLSTMGQFVGETMRDELERYWNMAMKPAGDPDARAYLNRTDKLMRASEWHRRRARRAGAD